MIDFEQLIIEKPSQKNGTTFRTLHYIGSKLRVLDFIKDVIDEVDPDKNGVCDLFSGTGSVSQHLSTERKIVSVDIQNYSHIICSALLNPISDDYILNFPNNLNNSLKKEEFIKVVQLLIDFEYKIVNEKLGEDLENTCNFLENASLYSAIENDTSYASSYLKKAQQNVINKMQKYDNSHFLTTKYFGGVYFSFKQAVDIDIILYEIQHSAEKYKKILLAALLSTASDIVNTVGKQFAQPIRPRTKNGNPKKGLRKQLLKDRNIDVFEEYSKWLSKYSTRASLIDDHKIKRIDFKQALTELDESIKVVYADPPYTRDHYSRFYHGLETICLMDFPKISKTKIGGTERLSRGLYRENRVQSDFCIKSKAPSAFEQLFRITAEKEKILILSYSPYDKLKGSHPRVVEIEFLLQLGKKYFSSVEIRSVEKISHSKLNRTELHLKTGEVAEVIIICKQ